MTIEIQGRFRVYFNRAQAAPLVWCIGILGERDHDRHVVVCELAVENVAIWAPVRTAFQRKETSDDDDGKPSAWLDVSGRLRIDGAEVSITPERAETPGGYTFPPASVRRACAGQPARGVKKVKKDENDER